MAVMFFFFNDTATTEIYTLSLHDALPISRRRLLRQRPYCRRQVTAWPPRRPATAAASGWTSIGSFRQVTARTAYAAKRETSDNGFAWLSSCLDRPRLVCRPGRLAVDSATPR